MSRTVLLLVAASLALALPAPPAAAEGPVDERCDSSGLLVCAGANAGASVACAITAEGVASCSWTRGFVWNAYSPVGLPGSSTTATSGAVETCVAGSCSETTDDDASSCAWVAPTGCEGDGLEAGAVGPFALAMGECLLVTVTEAISVEASAEAAGSEVAAASWGDAGEGAGQVCRLDDGR